MGKETFTRELNDAWGCWRTAISEKNNLEAIIAVSQTVVSRFQQRLKTTKLSVMITLPEVLRKSLKPVKAGLTVVNLFYIAQF